MALNVTTETFDQEVIQSEKTELKLVKVNIDQEHELQPRFGVASTPTIILFKEGEPSASVIGAQPKGAIERSLGLAV